MQVREAVGKRAQRRQLPDGRIWRQETAWKIGPVSMQTYSRKRWCVAGWRWVRKEDSRAKLVKAIWITIKTAGKKQAENVIYDIEL